MILKSQSSSEIKKRKGSENSPKIKKVRKRKMLHLICIIFIFSGLYVILLGGYAYIHNITVSEANHRFISYLKKSGESTELRKVEIPVFLQRSQWVQLGTLLKPYFLNVYLNGFGDCQNGFIFVSYALVGREHKYMNIPDNVILQCITFDISNFLESETGCVVPIRIIIFNDTELRFIIPYNKLAWSKLNSKQKNYLQEGDLLSNKSKPFRLKLKHFYPHQLSFGVRREELIGKGIPITIKANLLTHPHILLTGSSGSGKSYLLKILVSQVLERKGTFEVWFGDYKNSPDFRYLNPLPHYASGKDVIALIHEYYALFQDVLNGKVRITTIPILILDEYPALITYLEQADKKEAESIKKIITELLMLGRSVENISFPIWITAQRPDANIFGAGGARDNFMVRIALGNLSGEAKRMFTSDVSELPHNTYGRGQGLISIDGQDILEIYIPEIVNMDTFLI